ERRQVHGDVERVHRPDPRYDRPAGRRNDEDDRRRRGSRGERAENVTQIDRGAAARTGAVSRQQQRSFGDDGIQPCSAHRTPSGTYATLEIVGCSSAHRSVVGVTSAPPSPPTTAAASMPRARTSEARGPSEPNAAARSTTVTCWARPRVSTIAAAGNGLYAWTRTTSKSSSSSSSSWAVSAIVPTATSAREPAGLPAISSAPTLCRPKWSENSTAAASIVPAVASIASATARWKAK